MIVLDASAMVGLLINHESTDSLRESLEETHHILIAPYLLDIEVTGALRRLMTGRRVDPHRAQEFFTTLAEMRIVRYDHLPLLPRIWQLRNNFTFYDAAYIALAETTGAFLYTMDAKLTKGHKAQVVVFRA